MYFLFVEPTVVCCICVVLCDAVIYVPPLILIIGRLTRVAEELAAVICGLGVIAFAAPPLGVVALALKTLAVAVAVVP